MPDTPDQAFALLWRHFQHSNTKVADIAAALVTRVNECGAASPERCRAVTAAIDALVVASAGSCSPSQRSSPWT